MTTAWWSLLPGGLAGRSQLLCLAIENPDPVEVQAVDLVQAVHPLRERKGSSLGAAYCV